MFLSYNYKTSDIMGKFAYKQKTGKTMKKIAYRYLRARHGAWQWSTLRSNVLGNLCSHLKLPFSVKNYVKLLCKPRNGHWRTQSGRASLHNMFISIYWKIFYQKLPVYIITLLPKITNNFSNYFQFT